ncbi:MAG: L-seryl-tRNA(Sec) selenium transferase [candidate division BRC1 bacterium ADurb.BinA364]|nr:MAG: L-seryl-tRNA(Sec) selenium transferase [candidate division BRC1 bacterium ADurb.BinA364]
MPGTTEDPRRRLPSASALLEHPAIAGLVEQYSHPIVMEAIRAVLDWRRANLAPGDPPPSFEAIARHAAAAAHRLEIDRLRPVVNATGVILHTNLGRAALPRAAAQALASADRCCNMQIDMETGGRGKRNHACERLLCKLTGAEAAAIVNNNAAATLLVLAALCRGREVIVSRGQLIEIGGSFRLPDCIRESGAILVEVGTTNKTHFRDYENALSERTSMVLRVNPSNYRVIGFHGGVPIGELARLKTKLPVIVSDDLGCGALIDTAQFGLPHEPTVQESLAAGADIVFFSGDKLIGGPQAGIVAGKASLIARIKKHPLARMMRVCKLTDMALERTLRLFLAPGTLLRENPTLAMLAARPEALRARAEAILERIGEGAAPLAAQAVECVSAVGGGSLPDVELPSWALALAAPGWTAGELLEALRDNEPPVIGRIAAARVVLDMRTLLEGEDEIVAQALLALAQTLSSR